MEIPASVTEVQREAFHNCKVLRKVVFAENSRLKTIGSRCFADSGIEEITIPASVTAIRESAFEECAALATVAFQDASELEEIGGYCFVNTALNEITVPRNVVCIETCAFYNCERLRKISFQSCSKLSEIGNMCFSGSGLEEFRAPLGLRRIGGEAFTKCKSLKRAVLNEGLERLVAGNSANGKCNGVFCESEIEEIAVPGTLKEISRKMFCDCPNLRVVWVGEGCTANVRESVGESVEVLPAREAMFGSHFVWDLFRLREIVIPEGVERIRDYGLCNGEIESVTISASVKEICARAFYKCRKLKRVIFGEVKTAGVGAQSNSKAYVTSAAPSKRSQLRVIGDDAFYFCGSLNTILLPDTLEEIGVNAFSCSGLDNVIMPPSVRVVR